MLLTVCIGKDGNCICNLVVACLCHALYFVRTFKAERYHNLVRQPSLFYLTKPICGNYNIALLGHWSELPLLIHIYRRCVLSSLEEYSLHCGKIVLQTIVVAGEQTRAKDYLQHMALKLHLATLLYSTCTLIHLDRSIFAVDLYDLRHKFGLAQKDITDLILSNRSVHFYSNEV